MTIEFYIILAFLLFAIGLYGAFSRRSAIMILISIELMLNAVNISLVAFSAFSANYAFLGQLFTIMNVVVAAAEVTIGLAIVISIFRHFDDIDTNDINLLKW